MSTAVETEPAAASTRPVRRRVRRLDVVLVLVGYVLTRIYDAIAIQRAAGQQLPSIWTGPTSGYFDLAQLWDAQWYRIVATQGYQLPLSTRQRNALLAQRRVIALRKRLKIMVISWSKRRARAT